MAKRQHQLYETDKKTPFPLRLQRLCKLWQKKNEIVLRNEMKLLRLWASGFFDSQYAREHLVNLLDRGVFTIVPYLVEGNPKVDVTTLVTNYRPWAYTTKLALNYLIEKKMNLSENVFIPVAINSMFGAGITRVFTEYDRNINFDNEVIKSGHPTIKVIHDSDYIGDPIGKTRSDFIFEGDIYRLPTEYAKDLFSGKDKHGNEIADYIEPDCKLASDFSPENLTNPDFNLGKYAIRDYTTFIDLYLYDENTTVTIMPEGRKAKILREVEEDGPKESPYDYLGYKFFPNCSVPIPPAWFWHDQDVSINIVAKNAREQAESQKDLILADPTNKELARSVTNAKNMDVLIVKDPKEGIQKISVGGMNTESLPYMDFVEALFNKGGGTPDIMRGTDNSAPTLGQERMIFQNASRIVENMHTRYENFMASVIRKLAWRVWTDPTVYIPVIKTVPGLGELPEVFSQADKVGDFYDFTFDIVPFSTAKLTPEMKYQRMMQYATQWLLPSSPLSQQQGAELNIPLVTEMMGQWLGFDNFSQMYNTGIPKPTDMVSYQMQPNNKNKAPGQMSDAFGATMASREANSQRQEQLVESQETENV